jgi:hypothetical protein
VSNTYKVTVNTIYTVHADNADAAVESARETIRGGIFNDNVTITEQLASLYGPDDKGALSVSFFRIGNEQLG